jgi:FeoA domain
MSICDSNSSLQPTVSRKSYHLSNLPFRVSPTLTVNPLNHNNPDRDQHQHQQHRSWRFSFFGGTAEVVANEVLPELGASFPLTRAAVGAQVWIIGFRGQGGMNRLLGMGLNPGAELQVVSSQPSGSVVVAI